KRPRSRRTPTMQSCHRAVLRVEMHVVRTPLGRSQGANGVGVLRLRRAIRFANRSAALRMTVATFVPVPHLNFLEKRYDRKTQRQDHQDRSRVAAATYSRAVSGGPRLRHRARFHRAVLEQARRRNVPLRVLWRAAVWLGNKVRFGNGVAELLCRRRPPEHQRTDRHQLWHGSHRGALCPLRCAFGACVPGWPRTDRAALLHELGIPRLQAEEIISTKKRTPKKNRWSAGHLLPAGRARRPSLHRHSLNSDFEFRLR